jgi:hypothetical protein
VVHRKAGFENSQTGDVTGQAVSGDHSGGNGLSVELVWFADAASLSQIAPDLNGNHKVHGIFKSGIFVDDLDQAWEQLKSRQVAVAFGPFFDKAMQCRMFAIRDNNGNIVQFLGK